MYIDLRMHFLSDLDVNGNMSIKFGKNFEYEILRNVFLVRFALLRDRSDVKDVVNKSFLQLICENPSKLKLVPKCFLF
jgi:hypothetical protein